jgi:hypothetical protein
MHRNAQVKDYRYLTKQKPRKAVYVLGKFVVGKKGRGCRKFGKWDVYVNETAEVVHLFIGNDEIICTPGHRFLTEEGWKPASKLKEGDCLKTKGCDKMLKEVRFEKLASPIKTYNLNVQGFHTYVVLCGCLLIVHNGCGSYEILDDSGKTVYVGKGNMTRARVSLKAHHGSYIRYCDLDGKGDQFSFMVEAANMSRYTGLQNKIASPGKKLLELASPEELKEVFSTILNPKNWKLFF